MIVSKIRFFDYVLFVLIAEFGPVFADKLFGTVWHTFRVFGRDAAQMVFYGLAIVWCWLVFDVLVPWWDPFVDEGIDLFSKEIN